MTFLEDVHHKAQKQGPDNKTLVILPDDIARKNFDRALLSRELPSKNISTITLDNLAERIIDPEKKRMPRLLEKHVLTQLIVNSINQTSTLPLSELKTMPLDESNTQDSLAEEFNEFLRATDAGKLSPHLIAKAKSLADPFASTSSIRFAESFRLLEESIGPRIESIGDNIFLSRGHLLLKAREALASTWPPILEVNEVLLSNISVFDASVLKLLEQIDKLGKKMSSSFKVRIFLGIGTYHIFEERLRKAKIEFEEEEMDATVCSSETKLLDSFNSNSVKFVAAPERRREIEYAAKIIHELLLQDVHPSEILVAARDSGLYLNLVSEIFPAYGISYHVQTRRPYAHLPPYRFLKATTELIVAAKSNAINWDQITDPLRLGFCLPNSRRIWPVQPREFIYLEESLSRIQSKTHNNPISLSEWQTMINSSLRFPPAKIIAQEFLNWIDEQLANPPERPS